MIKLIMFGLIALYIGGIWKFWRGFTRTNFAQTLPNRVALSLLWPALFIANPSYRSNFRRAVKG